MTLDRARERMAEFLRAQDIDALCAWPEEARARLEKAKGHVREAIR